jgi:hypothetical protein
MDSLREQLDAPAASVVSIIDKAPDRRLTVPDAAALAGCDLTTAQRSLMILATFTGATLEVTDDGQLVYEFPNDYLTLLQKASMRAKLTGLQKKYGPVMYYLVRVSFGMALLTSLAIVYTTFIAVSSGSSNGGGDDDKKDGRSSSGGVTINFGRAFGPSPFDFLYYRPYYGYHNYPDSNYKSGGGRGESKLSFLESFFSYIFGDGDPNRDFSELQAQRVAALVRNRQGVVVAEELATTLNPPSVSNALEAASKPTSSVDESWVLPITLKFGGVPAVTDSGDIIYTFPELDFTVLTESSIPAEAPGNIGRDRTHSDSANWGGGPLPALLEREVPFSVATESQVSIAGALGIANLAGVLWLGRLLKNPLFANTNPALWFVLGRIFPGLLIYATLYNVIPAVRWSINARKNVQICERNRKRREWQDLLNQPGPILAEKLTVARQYAAEKQPALPSKNGVTGGGRVYSTGKSLETYVTDAEVDKFKDFDAKLRK